MKTIVKTTIIGLSFLLVGNLQANEVSKLDNVKIEFSKGENFFPKEIKEKSWYRDEVFSGWDDQSFENFQWFIGANVLDIVSTDYAIKNGAVETNTFLYSSNPDLKELIWKKTVMTTAIYYFADKMFNNELRTSFFKWASIGLTGISLNNFRVGGAFKF